MSDSIPGLMGSYDKCISLSEFLGEWLEVWTREFIKDVVINGGLKNINSPYH